MKGRRRRRHVKFTLEGGELIPAKAIRYLGVTLHVKESFGSHVTNVVRKAQGNVAKLTRLMPNLE